MEQRFLFYGVLVLALLWGRIGVAAADFIGVANAYFSAGLKNISADALYERLNDGEPTTDPHMIDTRSAEHFANAHIQGARNIAVTELFSANVLGMLPKDKVIVVICYSGQNSSQVVSVLNMLGYDAWNLMYGFGEWTQNKEAYVNRFDPTTVPDYATTTEIFEATEMYDLPSPLADTIQMAAQRDFAGHPRFISAKNLFEFLHDGNLASELFIIDVRLSVDHYNAGHINRAVYIDPKTLFQADNLRKLPPDKPIIVYCYSGQISGQVVAALRLIGYAAYSLTHGIGGWTNDAEVYVNRFDPTVGQDYPFAGLLAETSVMAEETVPMQEPVATPVDAPVSGKALPLQAIILGVSALGLAAYLAWRYHRTA